MGGDWMDVRENLLLSEFYIYFNCLESINSSPSSNTMSINIGINGFGRIGR